MTVSITWTQADVDALKAAILALASGNAVQTVSYSGPPARTVTYKSADLGAMRSLLAEMQGAVARATGVTPYKHAAFRKGFGRCE